MGRLKETTAAYSFVTGSPFTIVYGYDAASRERLAKAVVGIRGRNRGVVAGDYHTQGAYDPAFNRQRINPRQPGYNWRRHGNEVFSPDDKASNEVEGPGNTPVPGFLDTPQGTTEEYIPLPGQPGAGHVIVLRYAIADAITNTWEALKRNLRMFRTWATVLVLAGTLVAMAQTPKKQRDYVPDEKTAVRIAEAVLSAQYGEETVKAQLPLHTSSSDDYWIVQLQGSGPATSKGGGPAVWINKHSGCLKVMERMK